MTEPITAQRQGGNLQKFPEVGETPKEKRRDRSWLEGPPQSTKDALALTGRKGGSTRRIFQRRENRQNLGKEGRTSQRVKYHQPASVVRAQDPPIEASSIWNVADTNGPCVCDSEKLRDARETNPKLVISQYYYVGDAFFVEPESCEHTYGKKIQRLSKQFEPLTLHWIISHEYLRLGAGKESPLSFLTLFETKTHFLRGMQEEELYARNDMKYEPAN
ncbi:hypothetical protein C8J57DRAFT_1475879 [Mycena rebaudengoi]|nr:hypothetical protein C8J57DRAFT_1475879 [Mycena rebaudengoi]